MLRSYPSGFPIATTWSPTWTLSESPSRSGLSAREFATTLRSATSVAASRPTISARIESLFEKLT
jgi:hypothetical protein